MNRRSFFSSTLATAFAVTVGQKASGQTPTESELCVPGLDFVSAEATYFSRYEHFHLLSIPVEKLIAPPPEGYTTRTTTLDQASLDEKASMTFIKESGISEKALRHHSHQVEFVKEELERIASGEPNVEKVVLTPKGNLAHRFYFTAGKAALARIKFSRKS